jgi:hypothetical protein
MKLIMIALFWHQLDLLFSYITPLENSERNNR